MKTTAIALLGLAASAIATDLPQLGLQDSEESSAISHAAAEPTLPAVVPISVPVAVPVSTPVSALTWTAPIVPADNAHAPSGFTISTVFATKIHTITSCPPQVTDCPAHSTVLSTETVAVYTTVCPIEESEPTSASLHPAVPPASVPAGGGWAVPVPAKPSHAPSPYGPAASGVSAGGVHPSPSAAPWPAAPIKPSPRPQSGAGAGAASPAYTPAPSGGIVATPTTLKIGTVTAPSKTSATFPAFAGAAVANALPVRGAVAAVALAAAALL